MSFFKKLLGLDSAEKAARKQAEIAERQLREAQERQKLQAQNEMQTVTTIDSPSLGISDGTTDNRRRKRLAGQAVSNLGLSV